MFRFDIKTFERETVCEKTKKTVKTLEEDEGQEINQIKTRNDQNEERSDYEGKVGFSHRYTKPQQSPPKISSYRT